MGTFTLDAKSAVQDTFGANRAVERAGDITSSTDSTNTINLVNFAANAKIDQFVIEASGIGATDLTMTVGYQYDDTSLTSDTDAFFTALTIGQTGGGHAFWPGDTTSLNVTGFEAEGSGNLVAITGGGAIDTDFTLTVRSTFTYGDK